MSRRSCWQILAVVIALGMAQAARAAEVFVAIEPCRVVNTRDIPADGPKVENRDTRDFTIQGKCGVPVGAKAVAINVTVTEQEAQGFLSVFPSDLDFGVTAFHSNLNFPAVEFATDNGSIAPLAATTPDLSIYWDSLPTSAPGTYAAHVLIDVFGYFEEVDPGTQVPLTCNDGDFTSWDLGSGTWVCASPPVSSGGDVTDVNEGTGIDVATPTGPAPTVSIETTYRLPQGCTAGQVPSFDGSVWTCSGGAGTVTTIKKDPTSIYLVTSTTTAVPDSSCGAFPCNTATATASCLDNNDVAISGHCDMNPNTNSVILDQSMANVDTTAAAASFTCRWRNDDVNPNNGKAVIVCLVVP